MSLSNLTPHYSPQLTGLLHGPADSGRLAPDGGDSACVEGNTHDGLVASKINAVKTHGILHYRRPFNTSGLRHRGRLQRAKGTSSPVSPLPPATLTSPGAFSLFGFFLVFGPRRPFRTWYPSHTVLPSFQGNRPPLLWPGEERKWKTEGEQQGAQGHQRAGAPGLCSVLKGRWRGGVTAITITPDTGIN